LATGADCGDYALRPVPDGSHVQLANRARYRVSLQAELIRSMSRVFLRRGRLAPLDVSRQRRTLRVYERRVPDPPAKTVTIEKPVGGIPALRISRPESRPGHHILFLHGGGYVTGSPAMYRHVCWRFAGAARAGVIAIAYRLAPEHPYPAAIDDAFAAWKALLEEGADPNVCSIMGDSAGGGLALALALRIRDAKMPLPAALVAISPWTDLAATGASAQPPNRDPMLHADHLGEYARAYLAGADPRQPYASPLYGNQRDLPPTLLQVGSDEILRDDSIRMAERMREAGCQVTLEIWPRMPHVWHAFAPVLPEATRAIVRVGAFIAEHTSRRAQSPEPASSFGAGASVLAVNFAVPSSGCRSGCSALSS